MAKSVHSSWSVVQWGRYDEEPPDPSVLRVTGPDGRELELREPMDPAWHVAHWHFGAQIHDHERGVTYRATVGQDGRLDYLSVELTGDQIDQNSLRRLPIDRIRRVTVVEANEAKRGRLGFTLPGGVSFKAGSLGPGHRGYKPPLEDVAHRMIALGEGRQELAAHYGREVRTVDNWIKAAKNADLIPETRAELRERQEAYRAEHKGETKDA